MSDLHLDDGNGDGLELEQSGRVSRPTFAQTKAVLTFMEEHPELAHHKLRVGMGLAKFKKHWIELSNIVNSIDGAIKSTKGWIKFWADKRRFTAMKKRQIEQGLVRGPLTALEEKILDVCEDKSAVTSRKKRVVKEEPFNGDGNDSSDEEPLNDYTMMENNSRLDTTEADERQMNTIEKIVAIMDQQSAALSQLAQSTQNTSKALEKIADAAHVQAMAVDRLAGTFDTISSAVHDVRNAILGIDYTMKRCYPPSSSQQRQNTNLFS